MIRGVCALILLWLTNCSPASKACSAETCAGCCSAEGNCQEGQVGDLVTMCRVDEPRLALVTPSVGTLSPKWSPEKFEYQLSVPASVPSVTLTPQVTPAFGFPLTFEGAAFTSGQATADIAIPLGFQTKQVIFSVVGRYHPEKKKSYVIHFSRGLGFTDDVPAQGKSFGSAMARSGDTLVVYSKEGLHVFRQTATGWAHEALILSENGGTMGSFALSGNSLAIGMIDRVRVLTRVGSTWTTEAHLVPASRSADSPLGQVAIDGDTVVVGCPEEDSGARTINGDASDTTAPASGAAWVFTRTGTTWTQQAYLKTSASDTFDMLGTSLVLQGNTLWLGAPGDDSALFDAPADNTRMNSGAVFIFSRSGTTWTQSGYLKSSDPVADARFGSALAASNGVVAVSSTGSDSTEVYTGSGTTWTQRRSIPSSTALAITPTMLAVGSSGDDRSATGINPVADTGIPAMSSGAVSFLRYDGSSWEYLGEVKSPGNMAGGAFGGAIVAGEHEFLVAAAGENSGAGAVHVVTVP